MAVMRTQSFCTFLLFCLLAKQSFAQEQNPSTETQPDVTVESIETIRKQAANAAELDAETKQKIETACSAALDGLKKVDEFKSKAERFQQDASNVGTRVAELRQKLTILQQAEPTQPQDIEVAKLEQEIAQREVDLSKKKMALTKMDAEPTNRVSRRQNIRNLLLTYNQTLDTYKSQLGMPPPANEPPLLTMARIASLKVNQMLLLAEVPAARNELAKYDAEDATDFMRLSRDVASRQVDLAGQELQAWQKALSRKRAAESANKVRMSERALANTPEPIKFAAEENLEFAKAASALTAPIQETNRQLASARSQLEELQKQFKMVEQRVKEIGLTGSIGAMLRRQKENLPDLRTLRKNVSDRKSLIEDIQYKAYESDDLRSKPFEEKLKRIVAELDESNRPTESGTTAEDWEIYTEKLEASAQETAKDRRDILDDVIRNYKSYIDALFDLDATEQLLILEAQRFRAYIDERVLWIRSNKPLYMSFSVDESDLWALSPEKWAEVGTKFRSDIRSYPYLYLPVALLVVYLLWSKPRFRRELDKLGETAERGSCVSFTPTLKAGLITLLLAIAWPLIITFLAWRLNTVSNGSTFARALALSMFTVIWAIFPLEILRRICRSRGLANSHFNCPDSISKLLRLNILFFMPFALTVAVVTSLLYHSSSEHGTDAIERLTFIVGMIVLAFFMHRILHRETGIVCWYHASHSGNWIGRLKGFWYWGGLIMPTILIVMTVAGFYYTAQRLTLELYTTFLFLTAIQLVRSFLERWLTVRRRSISIEQLRARRAEAENASEVDTTGLPAEVEQMIPVEESEPDVSTNTEQTRRLIQTGFIVTTVVGLWLIWVDVLPALKMLDRWPVWMTTVPATTSASPGPTPSLTPTGIPTVTPTSTSQVVPTEQLKAVTLADIGLAILIGVVTFVCARNIPGLMEISVLKRLPFDNSVKYAITTITSYLIVLIGIILAFNAISIGWSKVQWLATALTFGLAFGLQEIFANFVAGLILLFERPIRVGDIVTIDDVTGVVSRIRIRATTITNWDRKDYVVPNKEFITGRLLNWTLSDKVNRITMNVGVAYGSDVKRAKELLKQTCDEHPLILDDPQTLVTFEGFGDNSLTLIVRTFLPDLENRLSVIDELHSQINAAFTEAGIEISFPQRDLHLRSVDPELLNQLGQRPQDPDSRSKSA